MVDEAKAQKPLSGLIKGNPAQANDEKNNEIGRNDSESALGDIGPKGVILPLPQFDEMVGN